MSDDSYRYRSSALVPGVERWPSEWSVLNRTLLSLPTDLPILRHLHMRPLKAHHREGLLLLHKRLFPINYDSRFYDAACGIRSDSLESSDVWSGNDVIGIGMFLPRSVLMSNCDCHAVVCCESSVSGSTDSDASTSRRCSTSSPPNSNRGTDAKNGDRVSTSNSQSESDPHGNEFIPMDCILNDATYYRQNDEFLVGFLTLWINRREFSPITSDNDYFYLHDFYEDVVFPFLQSPDCMGKNLPTIPNFLSLSADSYRFLFSNLYRNKVLLDYLSGFMLQECKTAYLLSAGITMGLRSRLLGTHLIVFLQSMLYFCRYGIFLYNGDMYYCSENNRDAVLSTLDVHLRTSMKTNSLELDDVTEYEVAPFRLHMQSVLKCYSRCETMPLSIYLHVIGYNKKACEMYRRANFICVTRIDDFYTINGIKYPANIFAYYMCPPCDL
ncbi:histone acetyltransferase MCC1-like [Babesia ovis]|uniref:histone acetyltransferase n=1 Tax=Babesia ovis TaxID=5869 RepID=A0A9W5TC57_BABOV|nr:histone acetyltransferase MCC1-like [Babesia ovis]